MFAAQMRSGIAHVGLALRMPEEFAVRWNDGTVRYRWWVWVSLMATAILGTTTYGMTMGLLGDTGDVLYKGLACTLAAGLAWGIPLPALYILNSFLARVCLPAARCWQRWSPRAGAVWR